MSKQYSTQEFNFKEPAVYKIVVQGVIDPQWTETNWGLQVSVSKGKGSQSITSMVGQINDQAALSGILSMLYDMHMTVISVNMLIEIEK